MKKKYVSPLFAELELELTDVLYDSTLDNEWSNDADDPNNGDNGFGDFDTEEDFQF